MFPLGLDWKFMSCVTESCGAARNRSHVRKSGVQFVLNVCAKHVTGGLVCRQERY